jgi:16S rRNA (guanine(1405)-N(7))-methyltransferase
VDLLESVVAAVASSKKYRSVCADTIRRIAEREMTTHNDMKKAVKATKRRLHQSYGAFEQSFDYEAAYRLLEAAYRIGSQDVVQAACREVMGQHASTRERMPILDQFYPAIFQITGRPASILDLG